MCSWRDRAAGAAAFLLAGAAMAQGATFDGIGRAATSAEVAAWDIDVRADFKGLPPGSGSVRQGQQVWDAKCASCHGVFGESGEVFNPLVGGTTQADIAAGRVARLTDSGYPGRTTLMKAAHVSTLWDYINRAMPWTQPKSLSVQEVYAVTAYMLNMGGIVPDDFVMSERNIADVQERMPNRNGLTTRHAMWPGNEFDGTTRPDVQGSACMSRCTGEPRIASRLPDHARDAHGNLADQNRAVGPQRGADTRPPGTASPRSGATHAETLRTAAAAPGAMSSQTPPASHGAGAADTAALAEKHGCVSCHGIDAKIIGPGFRDIATKYRERDDAVAYLSGKIRSGGSGAWGALPMPPQSLPDADAQALARWLAAGAMSAREGR